MLAHLYSWSDWSIAARKCSLTKIFISNEKWESLAHAQWKSHLYVSFQIINQSHLYSIEDYIKISLCTLFNKVINCNIYNYDIRRVTGRIIVWSVNDKFVTVSISMSKFRKICYISISRQYLRVPQWTLSVLYDVQSETMMQRAAFSQGYHLRIWTCIPIPLSLPGIHLSDNWIAVLGIT